MLRFERSFILTSHALQRISILFTLCYIVLLQGYPFFGKFGWLLFALLCGLNRDFALYATFFFSAFFVATGFFKNPLFSIKHFHIALSFLLMMHFLYGDLIAKIKLNYKYAASLLIWVVLILISIISSESRDLWALKMNGNILSCVMSAFILVCIAKRRKDILLNAILFFVFGTCLRIILAGWASVQKPFFIHLNEQLIYNNHIGFLASSSIFLLFPYFLTKQDFMKRFLCSVMMVILFIGLMLSCSRTGWFSFLISYCLFSALFYFSHRKQFISKVSLNIKWFWGITAVLFLGIGIMGFYFNYDVLSRILALEKLFDLDYLKYTFNDRQNFGFLGFFRLSQFETAAQIFKTHLLFGIGFCHKVIDFHSLYLSILGGTGILGLVLFGLFCYLWGRMLLRRTFLYLDDLNLFRIGLFCSFFVWLTYSFMETFIVQFNIWVLLAAGIALQSGIDDAELQTLVVPKSKLHAGR